MWEEIVAFLSKEWIGLLASAFVLVSFLFSNELKTRVINFVGCVIWVVYGFIVGAYSTSFMNAALIIVHVVKLTKMALAKKKQASAQVETVDGGADGGESVPREKNGEAK